jgi:hypothetical protein
MATYPLQPDSMYFEYLRNIDRIEWKYKRILPRLNPLA